MTHDCLTPEQVDSILRSINDPKYFTTTNIKYVNPTDGITPIAKLTDTQVKIFDNFYASKKGYHCINDRQQGSTLAALSIAIYELWDSSTEKPKSIAYITELASLLSTIRETLLTILENLPSNIYISEIVANNKNYIKFANGSTINFVNANADHIYRGRKFDLAILDNPIYWKSYNLNKFITEGIPCTTNGKILAISTTENTPIKTIEYAKLTEHIYQGNYNANS